jgi:activator of HSP90 ATPase
MAAIRQQVTLGAPPLAVYRALMDSRTHAKFTGSAARISPRVGGRFTVYDGYAEGRYVELVPGRKIVQSWRASDWPAGYYSTAAFVLAAAGGGTRLTFTQDGVPAKHAAAIRQGWREFYWEPLKSLFAMEAKPSSRRRASASSAERSPGTRRRRRR